MLYAHVGFAVTHCCFPASPFKGLIALRVWKIQRAVAPFAKGKQSDLSRLVVIIVESGK